MTRPRLLVLLTFVLLSTGLGATQPATASPASRLLAGAGYHEPGLGLCYDLSAKQAARASSTQDAVPCDAPHTLMTVKVKRLSKPVRWDSVYGRIAAPCMEAVYDALGTAKYAGLSAYDLWWFIPTRAERAKGARWVRCDVGLHQGTSGLGELSTSVALGPPPYADALTRCLVGKALTNTTCQKSHSYVAKTVFRLDRRARTREQYQRQGRRCASLLNVRRYAFDGPSAYEWKAGNHFMVCFKPQ